MRSENETKHTSNIDLHYIFISLNFLYLIISLVNTVHDASHLVHLTWQQAENQTNVYSSRRSSTVTYNFVKDNVRITREYPGLLEGINTWLWEIDKKKRNEDISFFIRSKDYKKIINNQIVRRKTIFGTQTNEIKPIPFFGLRTIDLKSNQFWLILDIWKYNYSILIAMIILSLPYGLIYLLKKFRRIKIKDDDDKKRLTKLGTYLILLFIIISLNLVI